MLGTLGGKLKKVTQKFEASTQTSPRKFQICDESDSEVTIKGKAIVYAIFYNH